MKDICRITINGNDYDYPIGTSFGDIAAEFQKDYEDDIVLVVFDGSLRELKKKVKRDGQISFVTTSSRDGKNTYRRSMVLLMEAAMHKVYPEYSFEVLQSLGQAYYCELFDKKHNNRMDVTEEFLENVSAEMKKMVQQDIPITKTVYNTDDVIEMFHGMGREDKAKLMKYRKGSRTNIYDIGGFQDYFYGYMLPSTGYLKYFDMKVYKFGFLLMFPGWDSKKVAEFGNYDKLFDVRKKSDEWGRKMGLNNVGDLNEAIVKGEIKDIILVQETWMEDRLGRIAEKIAENDHIKFIMVSGPSSSGKTSFSYRLSIQLRARGLVPHPIALDDFYVDRVDTPLDENGEYDYECLEALNIELFNKCMTELLEGKEVILPYYNFKTGKSERRQSPFKIGKNDVLIIEGIHGLNEELSYALPRDSKYKIYISALTQLNIDDHNMIPTHDGRLIRRMVRDSRTRNTDPAATIARWESVKRGEDKYIFTFQEDADEMFNTALIYELAVLKTYAEPLLFSIDKNSPEFVEAKRLIKFLDYFLPVPAESIAYNSLLREFIGGSYFPVG